MKCDIISFAVPADNNFNSATGASRGCIKCNTHNMVDFAPYGYENMLCPIGQIEKATDEALAKIEAARISPYPTAREVTNNEA